jgi:RNA 2',3'-cyclic 3'-phosphodiesterase
MYSTRCFIAIPVLPPAATNVLRIVADLRNSVDNVKWTREEELHITLKFLGEMDNRDLLTVSSELRRICQTVEAFTASLDGISTFPRGKPPRIVWAGIQAGRDSLVSLYEQLDAAMVQLGVPQEGRAYTPHLTLGRVGRGADLERLQQHLQRVDSGMQGSFDVNEVILFASLRERGKLVYEPLDRIELA